MLRRYQGAVLEGCRRPYEVINWPKGNLSKYPNIRRPTLATTSSPSAELRVFLRSQGFHPPPPGESSHLFFFLPLPAISSSAFSPRVRSQISPILLADSAESSPGTPWEDGSLFSDLEAARICAYRAADPPDRPGSPGGFLPSSICDLPSGGGSMSSSSSSAAGLDGEEEAFEHTLLVVREVSVYKIPPRSSSGGYKCGEWLQSDKIWSGRLRVVSCGERCEIRLEDPNSGELFAACFVQPGQRENSVETVLDSSRYFVLRIEDGRGKHAFIGLGFTERNEAFDFNVALSDHEKYVRREQEKEAAGGGGAADGGNEGADHIDIHPAVNHRLKEGETIRITVKNKPSSGTGMLSAAGLSGGASVKKPSTLIAPPPTGPAKIRSPLPPPPNDPAAARMASNHGIGVKDAKGAVRQTDPLSDLSSLKKTLPSSGTGSTKNPASGWAAF